MTKRVLAVDLDDIVWGFNAAYVESHNKKFGGTAQYKDIYTFDMSRMYGVSPAVNLSRVEHFVHHEHDTIQPLPYVSQTLTTLRQTFDIQAVTSRKETIRGITEAALEVHVPGVFSQRHFTNGFGGVGTIVRSKLDVCCEIGAVALVEDAPANALSVAEGGIPVLLLNHPWNQLVYHPELNHPLITRFADWRQVPEILSNL